MKRYLIIIEQAEGNFCAYSPDLPGCIATGPTREAVQHSIREAMQFHLAGMREEGLPLPEPTTSAEYVTV